MRISCFTDEITALGCTKKQAFSRISLCFFLLCTNIIKSSEKKFEIIWRSFDPPTEALLFYRKFTLKYMRKSRKIGFCKFWLSIFISKCLVDKNTLPGMILRMFDQKFLNQPIIRKLAAGSNLAILTILIILGHFGPPRDFRITDWFRNFWSNILKIIRGNVFLSTGHLEMKIERQNLQNSIFMDFLIHFNGNFL